MLRPVRFSNLLPPAESVAVPPLLIVSDLRFCDAPSVTLAPEKTVTSRFGFAPDALAVNVALPACRYSDEFTRSYSAPVAGDIHVGGRSMLLITGSSEYWSFLFDPSQ